MYNLFKNRKISTNIFILGITALIFVLISGTLGIVNIGKINDNITSMYENNVQPMTKIGTIRSSFLNLRLQATNSLNNYDSKNESNIQQYIVLINDNLKSYQETKLTDEEKKVLPEFTNYYSDYIKTWDIVSGKLKNKDLSVEDENQKLSDYGSLAEEKLATLSELNEKNASEANDVSNKMFSSTRNTMLLIFAVCIFLLFAMAYLIIKVINTASRDMIATMDAVAEGDFTLEIKSDSNNEFGKMKKSLSKTVESVSNILSSIKEKSIHIDSQSENLSSISEEMASSSENVSTAINEVAKGTTSQAQELINATMILNEFAIKLETIVQAIEDVDLSTKNINTVAKESSSSMQVLVDSVNKVMESFKIFTSKISSLGSDITKINEITNFINGISEQTNLLALNAAIEAARAGEAGKGFSVVAEEIRKLAEQSKDSSENINVLIKGISNSSDSILKTTGEMNEELKNQFEIIDNTTASFKKIINSINEIIPQVGEVSSSAISINNDKNTILYKIEETSSVAEEVSASAEEISASSEEMSSSSNEVAISAQTLSEMTKDVMNNINKFKLKN